jgi:serine/threonine protein phosphatase 1
VARTFVIGDIHGGLKALIQVLQKTKPAPADKLIFLGDYVDGWSESAHVIDYLLELSSRQPCIFLKGNHDEWCQQWLRTGMIPPGWLHNGGVQTLQSYALTDDATKKEHLRFLEHMRYYFIDEENRLFLHAGFTAAGGPMEEQPVSTCAWDRTLWETAITMDRRVKNDPALYPKRFRLFKEIYIGHTPTLHFDTDKPMQACNVWNIDTGAGFSGKLTVIDIDSKEYWQSEEVQRLYPEERGRNR